VTATIFEMIKKITDNIFIIVVYHLVSKMLFIEVSDVRNVKIDSDKKLVGKKAADIIL